MPIVVVSWAAYQFCIEFLVLILGSLILLHERKHFLEPSHDTNSTKVSLRKLWLQHDYMTVIPF